MKPIKEVKSIYQIPIPEIPNAKFEVLFGKFNLKVQFKVLGDKWLLWVKKGEKQIISGCVIHNGIILNQVTQNELGGIIYAKYRGEGKICYENRAFLEVFFGTF